MAPGNRSTSFPDGARARVVKAAPDLDGRELLRRLDLPSPRGTIVVNGSTAELQPDLVSPVSAVIGAVAGFAVAEGFTVLTGATDAGIFSILGSAMNDRSAPLVGVAPAGLVARPGDGPADQSDDQSDDQPHREALEPHHSHFVLVDGDEWGDETQALLALAGAMGEAAPTVAVLCGGGAGARAETLGHRRAGRPIVVIAGSGRFADEVAAAVASDGPGSDADVAEITGGTVVVCPLDAGPPAVTAALSAALGLGGPGR